MLPDITSNRRSNITKKLQELFQLPDSNEEEQNESLIQLDEDEEASEDALQTLEKIDMALPRVKGLEASDKEFDDLAEMAVDSYKQLMELGMNVEAKYSPDIFNSAGTMLGHAITAKTNKVNRKLKTIDQQLRKLQIETKLMEKTQKVENTPLGEGRALDRNEMLRLLSNKNDGNDA